MEGTIGEIRMFAGNFAPRSWAFCSAQLLPISQNTALFSILGTTYGGNGQTTFGLPDLRGRMPVGTGQNYTLGQVSGSETTTLNVNNLPSHNHTVGGTIKMLTSTTPANAQTPGGNYFATDGTKKYNAENSGAGMKSANTSGLQISPAGGSQPIGNMPPYAALNYIICMFGIFPSRN